MMIKNTHFLRIRKKNLPKDLAEELRKRARAAADQGPDLVFCFDESPIIEQMSLRNLGIKYRYTHKQTIQLSLF